MRPTPGATHIPPPLQRLFRSGAPLLREGAALTAEDGDCMEAAQEPAELITGVEEDIYTPRTLKIN